MINYLLSKPIPEEIRRAVWRLYLGGGISLDHISELTGVSKTSVFNIVRGIEKENPDYALMRALVVDLGKNGSDIENYASIIRISKILDEYGVDYTAAEEILKGLLATCYKQHWEPSQCVNALKRFVESAEMYGHVPKEHADYMNKLYAAGERIQSRIIEMQSTLHKQIKTHSIIEENLEVFLTENGVLRSNVNKELTAIEVNQKIEQLNNDLALYRKGKAVDPQQVEKLNEHLILPVTEQDILDKLEDIRRYPSRYSNLFEKLFTGDPKNKERTSMPVASLHEPITLQEPSTSTISVDQN